MPALALAACAGTTTAEKADVFITDLIKTPSERCAEAREIVAELEGSPDMATYRALAVAACIP